MFAQVALALTVQELRVLGLVHAASIAIVGIWGVLRRDLALVICACAYIGGSEVLWRQVRAPVFYLAAPYLLIVLSLFAVVFVIGRIGRTARLALLFAAILLPAMVVTIRVTGPGAREIIAFALSGPIALAAFVAFTSQVHIADWLYRRVLWIVLASSVAPLTIAISSVREQLAISGRIEFNTESNFVTSGGFGPVQVSSALSIGVMAAILLIIRERDRGPRIVAAVVASVMTVQMLLTFSRGGSTSVVIAVTGLAVVHVREPKVRNRILAIAALTLFVGYTVVFPWLETFTGGAFEERFSDSSSSRTTLAANDTDIFMRNPVFGVGPGMIKYQRLTYEVCQLRSDKCANEASSHTEFTRLLGEHGIPGLMAIVLLAMLAASAYRRAGPGREMAVAWLLWSVSQMFYANLRIAAVPIAFGLAFLRLAEQPDDHSDEGSLEATAADPPRPRIVEDVIPPLEERPVGFGPYRHASASSSAIPARRADREAP